MFDWLFHNNDGKWTKTTWTETIPESEVPAHIKQKLAKKRREADITQEMELEINSGKIKFCPYCGTKVLSSDAKFCSSCGKSLSNN